VLTNAATLTWLWKTQYLVTASAGADGTAAPTNSWVDRSASAPAIIATPAAGYGVDVWSLNGTAVQTGGVSYTLANVAGPSAVGVTFRVRVVTPTVTVAAGSYPDIFPVTVLCADTGSTLHYTTNGVDPTESDPVVTIGGTVWITGTMTLKVRAWKAGILDSLVQSVSYTVLNPRVSVTSPANGSIFYTPNVVTVLVSSVSTSGLGGVSVYQGPTFLGSTSAWSGVVWSNATAGDYVLTARAADAGGLNITTSMPVNVAVMAPCWAGALSLGGGWRWVSWFGFFAEAGSGWIYHNQHKWMYASGATSGDIWFWTTDMGWLWTAGTTYPYVYRSSDHVWLWYQKDTVNPRWFYNFGSSAWEQW
jgi:hypothetical protein